MDRRHIRYQQTNIDDSNDDCDDDDDDETNETTVMMDKEDAEVEGYEDEDNDLTTTDHPDPDPPSASDEEQDATEVGEDAETGLEEDENNAEEQTMEEDEQREELEETGPSVGNDGEGTGASGGNNDEEDDTGSLPTRIETTDGETDGGERTQVTQLVGSTDNPADNTDHPGGSPPPYGAPPSYDEAVQMQKPAPMSYKEAVDSEDLEWDQDEHVEPTRLQIRDGQDAQDEIELEDVVIVPRYDDVERGAASASIADTTFSTPTIGVPVPLDVSPSQLPPDEDSSSSWLPDITFSEISGRTWGIYGISILVAIVALLMVTLVPLSFSYIEYYQYGMRKGRISEVVEYAKEIYDMGRYAIGPGKTFKRYPAWAHFVNYDRIGFFTTDRLILETSLSFQYFIKQEELGLIEQKFDRSYEETIKSIAEAALKNQGATYTTEQYFSERGEVEQGLHDAIRLKLGGDCCPDRDECIRLSSCHLCSSNQTLCNRGYHVDVRHFQLKQMFIPSELTEKQLNVQLILEGNEEAIHRQSYQVIVKETEAIVEAILNNATEIIQNGTAQAHLILKKSSSTANARRESAHSHGLALLYDALDVASDDHKASVHWLRTLERHEKLITGISFKEYISLMQGLGDDD